MFTVTALSLGVLALAALFTSTPAQQFSGFQPVSQPRPAAQQSPRQARQFQFTGQEFPAFSQQGSQQSNVFRPSPQQFQQQQPQQHTVPAQSIQPPLANQKPTNFQNFQSPQQQQFQPQQQNFQQPQNFQQQQNFQQPQQNFQSQPQQNFQSPQQNFQSQSTFQQPQQQQTFQPQPQQSFQQNSFQNFQPQSNSFQPQQNFQQFQQTPQNGQFQNTFQQQQSFTAAPPTFATAPPQQPTTQRTTTPVVFTTQHATTQAATSQHPVTAAPAQEHLQRQLTQQLRQRTELLQQLNLSRTAAEQGKAVFLANGQKLQVLQVAPKGAAATPKPAAQHPTRVQTIQAPGLLDAVTKGVVPSGVDYEVIRQSGDGNQEIVQGLPADLPKKVTFVILEEQQDGSYKVQGVRKGAGIPEGSDVAAEAAKAAATGEEENQEVQSLIKKLQNGQLKLPSQPGVQQQVQVPQATASPSTARPVTQPPPPRTPAVPSSTAAHHFFSPTPSSPRPPPPPPSPSSTPSTVAFPLGNEASQSKQVTQQVPSPIATQQLKKSQSSTSLADALRVQGLRSMAQFLEQVGLDRALNDSAPFTMFAPTDLAFRALLLELGGAERAQAKFRASPRLLSGLLLHHVIPGTFRVTDLQDEMTGVSLAGTQLRVNVYSGTDTSFNARKVVTINGGSVSDRVSDVSLPGGSMAHAVNRVLFPLPVGDILTSLEADPARRFTRFVRAARDSGIDELLKAPLPDSPDDGRTYTVFAPTDEVLGNAEPAVLTLLESPESPERRAALRVLLERHIASGTLFSEGVTYYQAASSLAPDHPLRLFNDNGIFKVNSARVISPDIPATNGVIHAIDSLI